MKKRILPALFFIGLFVVCRHGAGPHRSADTTVVREPAADSVIGTVITGAVTDTALVSLKTFHSIALEDVLSQDWKFEDADQPHWNEIFWDSVTDTRQYPELALFADHRFTQNARCGIRLGKWSLDKGRRELVLQPVKGPAQIYIVRQIALKQLELARPEADGQGQAIIRLSAEGLIHRRPLEDPFHPSNNLWRLKPAAPETAAQIRARVRDCVHFYSLFFLDNHQRQERDISFSGLPTCFVWYNGAIGVTSKPELGQSWIDCFYSTSQALTAYDLVAAELDRHTLKWPEHPSSWVLQTGQVLDQLSHKF